MFVAPRAPLLIPQCRTIPGEENRWYHSLFTGNFVSSFVKPLPQTWKHTYASWMFTVFIFMGPTWESNLAFKNYTPTLPVSEVHAWHMGPCFHRKVLGALRSVWRVAIASGSEAFVEGKGPTFREKKCSVSPKTVWKFNLVNWGMLHHYQVFQIPLEHSWGIIPVTLHCDGAEFFRNSEFLVWSFGSLLTSGDVMWWHFGKWMKMVSYDHMFLKISYVSNTPWKIVQNHRMSIYTWYFLSAFLAKVMDVKFPLFLLQHSCMNKKEAPSLEICWYCEFSGVSSSCTIPPCSCQLRGARSSPSASSRTHCLVHDLCGQWGLARSRVWGRRLSPKHSSQ